MKFRCVVSTAFFLLLLSLSATPSHGEEETLCLIPPVAQKIPKEFREHGNIRIDNYFWMKERDSKEVLDYLHAENEYAERYMSRFGNLEEVLFEELKGRVPQEDDTVPYRKNGYYYYQRFEEGKEYAIGCRKNGSLQAPEEIFLDANRLAEGYSFFNLDNWAVSPDGNLVAYAVDTVGRRKYDIYIKNLATGQMIGGEPIHNVTPNFVWANDNRTLFYTRQHPETLRWYQVFRHTAGGDPSGDILVYEEKDAIFGVAVDKTSSDRYILLWIDQTVSNEYRYIDADYPESEPVLFAARERNHEYQVDHAGDQFYIRTNYNAKNFRVMTASPGRTARADWMELVPHREERLIEGILPFRDHLVVSGRVDGLARMEILLLADGTSHEIEFDEPAYHAWTGDNYEVDTPVLRYHYSSMTTPETVYDYNMESREKTQMKREKIPGGFDPAQYVAERVMVPARDGSLVPMSLLYRKGLKLDGSNPAHVYAYGSYGLTSDAEFVSHRFTLVDRGFLYAIAHTRGGDMLGRQWYEDGKLMKKKNTFTDFIDCSDYLVQKGYTSKELLFCRGGSAGGLLVGAVINMRPDLFKGAVADVPFVDVVTSMLDDTIPLTTSEYDEWGNPNEKEAYNYMLSYSPYDNVEAREYPALLITAGYHDSQVQYWEPAKWAAKMRAMKTDTNTLLLRTNMSAGHGGAYGRFERYREYAFIYAFMLGLIGIEE